MQPSYTQGSLVPPYGPAQGMVQGLDLLRRTEPATVNIGFLKNNRIAPGNEYKVVGALRFLGLIDETGAPTEKARLIKARGVSFTNNLRGILEEAYSDLFEQVDIRSARIDDVYNYFILHARLKPEMARKATRFFTQLCQLAELSLTAESAPAIKAQAPNSNGSRKTARVASRPGTSQIALNISLAIDPVVAKMDEAELATLLRKIVKVARGVSSEVSLLV